MSILEPSTVERYEDMPSAASSAAGLVVIGLQQVPVGTRCVFTVSIPNSPPLAAWSIAKGASGAAQILMSWAGPTPVGPFTIDGPERLFVTGTGLAPNAPIQAIALGKRGPAALIEPEVPTGPAQFTVPTGGPPTVLDTWTGTGAHTIANIPSGLRAVTLHANAGVSGITSVIVGGASGVNYFNGEWPNVPGNGNPPLTFAINPDETGLLITTTGPATGFVALGSFIERALSMSLPLGMPASASQLATQSQLGPGLDRALWTARADCPRFTQQGTFAVGAGGALIAAPPAGQRIKLYNFLASGVTSNATRAVLQPVGIIIICGTNMSQPFDFQGLELPAASAFQVTTITLASIQANVTYDVVPA